MWHWHGSEISEIEIDKYLKRFIKDFLHKRYFRVKVNNCKSEWVPINCSVPQGSVIAPILFLININDIPLANEKNLSYSSLFADFFVKKSFLKMIAVTTETLNNRD